MGDMWNHDIPNEYFLNPVYDPSYAPSLNRHGSELSTHSSRSTGSHYAPYSSTAAYYEPLQSSGDYSHQVHYLNGPSVPLSPSATRRTSASSRHLSTSSSSSSSRERFYCEKSNCFDKHGSPSSFSRRADLNRHYQSVHCTILHSCPWPRCERRGDNGFTRLDHLTEHRRGYHHEDLPKRETFRER